MISGLSPEDYRERREARRGDYTLVGLSSAQILQEGAQWAKEDQSRDLPN